MVNLQYLEANNPITFTSTFGYPKIEQLELNSEDQEDFKFDITKCPKLTRIDTN